MLFALLFSVAVSSELTAGAQADFWLKEVQKKNVELRKLKEVLNKRYEKPLDTYRDQITETDIRNNMDAKIEQVEAELENAREIYKEFDSIDKKTKVKKEGKKFYWWRAGSGWLLMFIAGDAL